METYASAVFMCNWPIQSKTEFKIHRLSHFFAPQSIRYFQNKIRFAYGRLPQVVRIRATVLPSNHQLQMYNQHTCYLQTRHPPIPPESHQTPERRATYGDRRRLRKATPGRQVLQKLRRSRHRQNPPTTHRAVPLFPLFNSPPHLSPPSRFPIGHLPPNPNQGPLYECCPSVHYTSPDLSHQQQLLQLLLLFLLLLCKPRLGRRIITTIIPPFSLGAVMGDAWWKEGMRERETSVALAVAAFACRGESGVSLRVFQS